VDGIIGYSSDLKSFPYWTIRPKFPDDSAEQVLYVASVYDDSSVTPSGDPINILIPDASPKLRTAGFKVYEPEEIKVCDSSRRVVEEGIERAFSDWSIDLRPSLEDLISRYNLPMFGFSSPKPFLAVVHDVRKGTSDTEVASFLRQLANTLGVYKSLRAYAEMYVARSHHILQSFNPFRMSYSRDKYRLYGRPQIH